MHCNDPLSQIKLIDLGCFTGRNLHAGTLMFKYFIPMLEPTPNIRYTINIHSFNYYTRTLLVLDAKMFWLMMCVKVWISKLFEKYRFKRHKVML